MGAIKAQHALDLKAESRATSLSGNMYGRYQATPILRVSLIACDAVLTACSCWFDKVGGTCRVDDRFICTGRLG